MSMHLDFEPDYWYKDTPIARYHGDHKKGWMVYWEDGMRTYSVMQYYASTLKQAKQVINTLIENNGRLV